MIGILTQLDVVSQAASWKPQMAQKGRWRKEETQASDGVFLTSVNKMCFHYFIFFLDKVFNKESQAQGLDGIMFLFTYVRFNSGQD